MTILEAENFYKADERKYKLEENEEFLKWYFEKQKEGYQFIVDVSEMQKLIDKIVFFYEFKYPNALFNEEQIIDKGVREEAGKLSRNLGIKQLKFRLHHDYVQFLECNYRYHNHVCLERKEAQHWELSRLFVWLDPNGYIQKNSIEELQEFHFLDDVEGVRRIEDLLGRFESIDTDVDYSDLKKCVVRHKYLVSVRNKILSLVPLAMIYSKNTIPKYGYFRAKSFIRTFNREYHLKMDLKEVDEIMNRDYSKKEKVKIK